MIEVVVVTSLSVLNLNTSCKSSVKSVLKYVGKYPNLFALHKFIFFRVSIIWEVVYFSLSLFSKNLKSTNDRKQVVKWAIILSSLLKYTGLALNSIIRADGSPKYAMISMLIGAIANIILDPIFIFVFKMSVEGAALATIISQFLTFIINVFYIKKFKSIKITKKDIKLKLSTIKTISVLGISSFITQMSIVLVMAFENNLLGKFGAESEFGAEIPITVLGIVMKISQILNSVIIGIAAGAQPILGYNYGAEKFDRVKKTLKMVLGISLVVSTFAFILFQTIPDKLISVFGSENDPR